jgi:hypothetical protein
MTDIPYLEDIYKLHFKNTMNVLFPNKSRNKLIVYLISILHIIGALVLQWGIFLKPNYLFYYFIYLLLILFSYYIFENHCFITLISNKYSGIKKTPLYIKKKTAKNIIIINSIIALIGFLIPKMSLYNIIKYIFD